MHVVYKPVPGVTAQSPPGRSYKQCRSAPTPGQPDYNAGGIELFALYIAAREPVPRPRGGTHHCHQLVEVVGLKHALCGRRCVRGMPKVVCVAALGHAALARSRLKLEGRRRVLIKTALHSGAKPAWLCGAE